MCARAVFVGSVFGLVVFTVFAQGETNLIKRLPNANEAVERLREQGGGFSFYEVAKKTVSRLEKHRIQNNDQILKLLHGRSDSYMTLEWVGGFQGGYNIVALTEKEAVVLRTDSSGICAMIRLSHTYVAILYEQVKSHHAALDAYQGGSSLIEFDTPLLFGKIAVSPMKEHSFVTFYPDIPDKMKGRKEPQGYKILGSIMAVLKQAIKKKDFVFLDSLKCDGQGASVLRSDFFDDAF